MLGLTRRARAGSVHLPFTHRVQFFRIEAHRLKVRKQGFAGVSGVFVHRGAEFVRVEDTTALSLRNKNFAANATLRDDNNPLEGHLREFRYKLIVLGARTPTAGARNHVQERLC